MIFSYDEEFMNIKIYDDIPDIREGKPKEIIEIPDIMDAWEFYKSVVRCKECKKANTEDCSHSYWDDDWGEWRVGYKGDNWFCADGEREGE